MSADRADAKYEVVELMARLLVTTAQSQRASFANSLPGALPWMRFLPHAGAEAMTAEFLDATEAAAALGNTAAIASWWSGVTLPRFTSTPTFDGLLSSPILVTSIS